MAHASNSDGLKYDIQSKYLMPGNLRGDERIIFNEINILCEIYRKTLRVQNSCAMDFL